MNFILKCQILVDYDNIYKQMQLRNSQKSRSLSPWRVLLPICLGTGLSLLGDSSMYTVLSTHVAEAGVALASVGILLSANRWVRLPLNGPAGLLLERWRRKPLFVGALFLGALSTSIYALTRGFWPLLFGRLLWGLAWVGIWVGGNTIVMDISRAENRGKWVGVYQISFFTGAAGGALLGGVMTDWIGFHNAMGLNASLTLLGGIIAGLFLPETQYFRDEGDKDTFLERPINKIENSPLEVVNFRTGAGKNRFDHRQRGELASAIALFGVNRLAQAGFLVSTLGLYLQGQLGEVISFGSRSVGVATLTGLGLGLTTLIATTTTPIAGGLSDKANSRWTVAAAGLISGVLGFGLLTLGTPWSISFGLVFVSIASGSNMNMSTSLVGDLAIHGQHGRRLGVLFTIGDLASAVGPPLAFALIPTIELAGVYGLAAGLYALMAAVSWGWARGAVRLKTGMI